MTHPNNGEVIAGEDTIATTGVGVEKRQNRGRSKQRR